MIEVWRPIAGFEGAYEVSSLGRVKSLDRKVKRGDQMLTIHGRIMSPGSAGKGYRKVMLCLNGTVTHRYVHVLVLETFIGPAPAGMECAHGNGKRDDNRLSNLRWDTRSGNFSDKSRHGTETVGERHGRRKLTAIQVRRIRATPGTRAEVGRRFGISPAQVSRIVLGRNWRFT